jgi:hypothetical protein
MIHTVPKALEGSTRFFKEMSPRRHGDAFGTFYERE